MNWSLSKKSHVVLESGRIPLDWLAGVAVLAVALAAATFYGLALFRDARPAAVDRSPEEPRPADVPPSTILGTAPAPTTNRAAGQPPKPQGPASSAILGAVPGPAPASPPAQPAASERIQAEMAKLKRGDAPPAQPTFSELIQKEVADQKKGKGALYDEPGRSQALAYERLSLDDPLVVEAGKVLANYLSAGHWRARRDFVFDPGRMEGLMQEQYEKRQVEDPEHGALINAGILTAGSSKVINLQFACYSRLDGGLRANFHQTVGGKWRLDWESWVGWGDKSWQEFKEERTPIETTMRAVASESSYYNYEFSESWRWLAVKLRSPDGLHSVTGYVERNSLTGVALANLIGVPLPHKLPDGTPMPALRMPGAKALVTLKLAFRPKAESDHCVRITGLLADRWLLFPGERS